MSVEYEGIAIYGITFYEHQEAKDWLNSRGIDIDTLPGFDSIITTLACETLNSWTGKNVAIGFAFELGKPLQFYYNLWFEQFGDTDQYPTAFVDVKVY